MMKRCYNIYGGNMKKKIQLVCEKCFRSNYNTNKSSINRVELRKFCKFCKEHTLHKENK